MQIPRSKRTTRATECSGNTLLWLTLLARDYKNFQQPPPCHLAASPALPTLAHSAHTREPACCFHKHAEPDTATGSLYWLHLYLEYSASREMRDSLLPLPKSLLRTSLVGQWLRLCGPNAGGPGSIPDQAPRFPHAATKSLHAATKTQRSQVN